MAKILIVDDEPTLLKLLTRFLERQGHEVTACDSASAALHAFRSRPSEFALAISDLTLSDLKGEDLIAQLRQLQPGLPALIASGYPYEPQLPGVGFLQKPFLPQALAQAIEKLLKR
jgi:DNA-binding NtrC family response regulator